MEGDIVPSKMPSSSTIAGVDANGRFLGKPVPTRRPSRGSLTGSRNLASPSRPPFSGPLWGGPVVIPDDASPDLRGWTGAGGTPLPRSRVWSSEEPGADVISRNVSGQRRRATAPADEADRRGRRCDRCGSSLSLLVFLSPRLDRRDSRRSRGTTCCWPDHAPGRGHWVFLAGMCIRILLIAACPDRALCCLKMLNLGAPEVRQSGAGHNPDAPAVCGQALISRALDAAAQEKGSSYG